MLPFSGLNLKFHFADLHIHLSSMPGTGAKEINISPSCNFISLSKTLLPEKEVQRAETLQETLALSKR